MKYIIPIIACCILFTQCKKDVQKYPTGTYDTLGVQWMTIDRDNITYYFQGTGAEGASIYTDLHEEAYNRIAPIFKPQLPQKLRFFVWTSWQDATLLFSIPEDVGGFAISRECVCHTRADIPLGHEMTHVISYWSGGVEPTEYSEFINEGIAVAFDLEGDDKLETAKKAIEGKNFPGIRQIWSETYDAPSDILYPVGGAFIDFLYKKNMNEQFFRLIKEQSIENAEEIYGKDQLNSFINEFDTMLGL